MSSSSPKLPQSPKFPSFSDLSSLQASIDDVSSKWADKDDDSTTPPPAESHQSPPLPPLPPAAPFDISDLDPYAPASPFADEPSRGLSNANAPRDDGQLPKSPSKLLGDTIGSTSLLEIISSSEEEESGEDSESPSPTTEQDYALSGSIVHENQDDKAKEQAGEQQQQQPPQTPKGKKVLGLGGSHPSTPAGGAAGGAGGFLGGMFRSLSGAGDKAHPPLPSDAPPPLPSPAPSPAPPVASTSTATAPPPSEPAGITNPLHSIATIFRNSRPSTPSIINEEREGLKEKEMLNEKIGLGLGGEVLPTKEQEEKEVVFDFNRFLEQMRARSAEPVAKYLRSFLKEFSRRPPYSILDQIRVINDFLTFIDGKMRTVDPWKAALLAAEREGRSERGEQEFEMAGEAMEKLVMNRLWHLTFSPALDLSMLPGHNAPTDDLERDHVLAQRIRLFTWVEGRHLDLPFNSTTAVAGSSAGTPKSSPLLGASEWKPEPEPASAGPSTPVAGPTEGGLGVSDGKKKRKAQKQTMGFIDFAKRELCKMNEYKAPRDKLICVLNCCKVIFGLIRHLSASTDSKGEEGADAFVPLLIFVVLKANPDHLVSNLQYIQRFRNPEKLQGEGGYYLSSLTGAISFIETMDASHLSDITQAEFEANVEEAIRNLPVDPNEQTLRLPKVPTSSELMANLAMPLPPPPPRPTTPASSVLPSTPTRSGTPSRSGTPTVEVAGVDSDSPDLLQQPGLSFPESTKAFLIRSTDSVERIVSKPLSAIGRIFDNFEEQLLSPGGVGGDRDSKGGAGVQGEGSLQPQHSGGSAASRRRSYAPYTGGQNRPPVSPTGGRRAQSGEPGTGTGGQQQQRVPHPHQGMFAPDGVSSEAVAEQIERMEKLNEEKRSAALETLRGIFPQLENEVLEMVLLSKSGDVAQAIESLLDMS
ncbi:hypothetical protein MNV49_007285 [Pseudohyphozyma bogoriensis]|nr:hypothetical protein MNV49_007285 [Pseudohyphozyma bogoriensis]